MTMRIDIDITQQRRLRLGVAHSGQICWNSDGVAQRVRAADLGAISRTATRLRRERPGVDVVADIDAVIAADARTARTLCDTTNDRGEPALLYVGTPSGLAGLIADIYSLGITDGAVLIPRAAGTAELIRDAVIPALNTLVPPPTAISQRWPA